MERAATLPDEVVAQIDTRYDRYVSAFDKVRLDDEDGRHATRKERIRELQLSRTAGEREMGEQAMIVEHERHNAARERIMRGEADPPEEENDEG